MLLYFNQIIIVDFNQGYKRKVATLKQEGAMSIKEGKAPLSREGINDIV
jgi:hypothetical protein